MNLTQKAVEVLALPKGRSELIVFDDELAGFGLRLRRAGSRTWIYQYKIGIQHRRVTIGSTAALTAAQARRTAGQLHAAVRLGRDPAGEKEEGRIRAAETMETVLRPYLSEKRGRVKPGSYAGIERHLLKHCRRLHGLQLVKIDRRTVAAAIAMIAAKSGPTEANRVRASLSAFFSWCMAQGLPTPIQLLVPIAVRSSRAIGCLATPSSKPSGRRPLTIAIIRPSCVCSRSLVAVLTKSLRCPGRKCRTMSSSFRLVARRTDASAGFR